MFLLMPALIEGFPQFFLEGIDSRSGYRRYEHCRQSWRQCPADFLSVQFCRVLQVAFCDCHDAPFVKKLGAVRLQFLQQGPVCLTRIVRAGDAEEEHRVPFDMPEEANPQPASFVGTFYDAWNVGHREGLSSAIGNDPQLGDQCGERVVGNLGPCGGNGGQERGFAGVRQSYQSDIGQYLQFEYEPALLCGLPEGEFPWRPVGRRLEVVISEASLPSLTEDPLFPVPVEFEQDLSRFGILDYRADRNVHIDIRPVLSVPGVPAAVLAVFGPDVPGVLQVDECPQAGV